MGQTAGEYSEWDTSIITGETSGATCVPTSVGEDLQDGAMNDNFDFTSQGGTIDFVDFTETNPFGNP